MYYLLKLNTNNYLCEKFMPIYDFICPICKNTQEITQKISDPAPICHNLEKHMYREEISMIKQISKTSFVLRGEGWYKDLYGKSPKKEK